MSALTPRQLFNLDEACKPLVTAYGVTPYLVGTVVKLFPEFEKYMPAEREKTDNLPIATDVVPALVVAGWPKGSKKGAGKNRGREL